MLVDLTENRNGSMLRETLPRSMFEPVQGRGSSDMPGVVPASASAGK